MCLSWLPLTNWRRHWFEKGKTGSLEFTPNWILLCCLQERRRILTRSSCARRAFRHRPEGSYVRKTAERGSKGPKRAACRCFWRDLRRHYRAERGDGIPSNCQAPNKSPFAQSGGGLNVNAGFLSCFFTEYDGNWQKERAKKLVDLDWKGKKEVVSTSTPPKLFSCMRCSEPTSCF